MDSTPENKPKRGNPNFKKGVKNQYYANKEKDQPMEKKAEDLNNQPKNEIPIDIFSDVIPQSETLPLNDEVKTNDYAVLQEEPAATTSDAAQPNDTASESSPATEGAINTNPATEKTLAEMQSEAEQLVDFGLRGYDKLHGLARWGTKVDENAMLAEHEAGKINLNQTFPLKGNPTLGSIIRQYNSEIDETIVVDEKFKTDITPPLVRIAMKHKLGMSDEFRVLSLLGEDVLTKASVLFGLKKSMNMIISLGHEMVKVAKQTSQPKQEPIIEDANNAWRDVPSAEEVQ